MKRLPLLSLSALLLTASMPPLSLTPARAEEAPPPGSTPRENQPVTEPEPEEKKCGEEGSGKSRSRISSSFASISAGLSALAPDMAEPSVVGLRASNIGAPTPPNARSGLAVPHFPGGISAHYATPASLTPFGKGGEILRSPEGWVRQIKTETGFLNIEKIPDGYCITGYNPAHLSPQKNAEGFYTLTPGAQPLSRRTVTALDGGGSKIKIEETTWYGLTPRTETLLMQQTPGNTPGTATLTQTWSNHNGVYKRTATTLSLAASSSKARSAISTPPVENYLNTVEELGTDGNYYIVKRTAGARTTYRWDKGEVPVIEHSAVDESGAPLPENITSTWTYHTDPADRNSYGRPATLRKTDGYWENYAYSDNRMAGIKTTKTWSPWTNTPAPEPGQIPTGVYRLKQQVSLTTDTGTSGTTVTVNGVPIQKEWTENIADGPNTILETRHQPHSGGDKTTLTKRYCRDKAKIAEPLMGKPLLIKNADGSLETCTYALDGDTLTTTRDSGYGTDDTVTKGIRTLTKKHKTTGKLREETRYALEGGQAYWLGSKTGVHFDPLGNCLKWIYDNNSENYTEQRRDCCQINWERTRDGIETTYTRNADGKLTSETTRGITRTWERKGLTTTEWKQAEGETARYLIRETLKNLAGRTISETTPVVGGRTVTTSYTYNTPARTLTTTTPTGTTQSETTYADNQLATSTTTTGLTATYTYTPNSSLGGGLITATQETGVTKSTETDLLSQQTKTIAGNGALTTNTYNLAGQLTKTLLPDGETQLYQHQTDGTTVSGLDLDGDSTLNPAVDRMSRTVKTFDPSWPENKGSWKTETQLAWQGDWTTQTSAWNTEDGTLGRWKFMEKEGYDVQERLALRQRGKNYTVKVTRAEGLIDEITYSFDKAVVICVSILRKDAVGNTIDSSSMILDIWGNVLDFIDLGSGKTTFSYDVGTGMLLKFTSPENLETSYLYDELGRLVTTVLPNTSRQYIAYDSENNIVRQWGSLQYPVSFEYDIYGRQTAMITYRLPVGEEASWPESTEGDRTQWTYGHQNAPLSYKQYADGKGVIYTYTLGGKLETQTNARGNTSTWSYDKAGQKTSLIVNDNGLTPKQRRTYDQWGRPVSIETENVASYTYRYNDQNQLIRENIILPAVKGTLARQIERTYDTLGRISGYQLKQGNHVEQSIEYAYNSASQLASITADGKSFAYEYVENVPQLLAGMTSPVHTVTNSWETNRGVLSNKTNTWKNKSDKTSISSYTYTVNNLGQRTAVAATGEAFVQSPADWTWGYDVLGQITQANTDHYTYSQIGNRLTSGKQNGYQATYTTTPLNQYSAINTARPTYDPDGNQLTGLNSTISTPHRAGLSFTYNASNRPVEIRHNGELKELRTYDHMGRRIRKGDTLILYDGYNAIAQYNLNTHALKITYAWGNDLYSSLQKAGGAGSLLNITEHGKQTPLISYPCYDGNGNITEYLAEENGGTLAAHYEYDAFGNVVKKTGEKEYSYQFSTKPYDVFTGLNYYNHRDYDPEVSIWISRDKSEEYGFNLYNFIQNDAVNYIDDLGERRLSSHQRKKFVKRIKKQINRGNENKNNRPTEYPAPSDPSNERSIFDDVLDVLSGNADCESIQYGTALRACYSSMASVKCPECCIIATYCKRDFWIEYTTDNALGTVAELPCSELRSTGVISPGFPSETYFVDL